MDINYTVFTGRLTRDIDLRKKYKCDCCGKRLNGDEAYEVKTPHGYITMCEDCFDKNS